MATQTKGIAAEVQPRITVEEWGELEGPPYFELVNRTLEEKPGVAIWREIHFVELIRRLANHVRLDDLGQMVGSRANLRISPYGGRQPDIFLIPTELDHLVGKDVFFGVPPLVIEIFSPSNEDTDRIEKYGEYASLGVGEYWTIDFGNPRVEIHALTRREDGTSGYELKKVVTNDAIFHPALFPGLEIPLAENWATKYQDRV